MCRSPRLGRLKMFSPCLQRLSACARKALAPQALGTLSDLTVTHSAPHENGESGGSSVSPTPPLYTLERGTSVTTFSCMGTELAAQGTGQEHASPHT